MPCELVLASGGLLASLRMEPLIANLLEEPYDRRSDGFRQFDGHAVTHHLELMAERQVRGERVLIRH